MLNEKFRYVALDFETTGLDCKKDEAIQIGLVELDVNWSIVKQFKSFLKPQKDIQELRDLVAYITGISLEDLHDAPSIFDLESEIQNFFWENTVLIWHNIQFDIDFLKKYFPDIFYYDAIDTMYLAQNLVHFAPSYALDVLVEYLLSQKEFKFIFDKIHSNKAFNAHDAHDALYDSKNALCLFFYAIQTIQNLMKKYPILSTFVQKNTWLYHKILKTEVDRASQKKSKISLPNLEKELPKDVSVKSDLSIDLENLKHKWKYFIGNVDIELLISTIVASNKYIILSFASLAKLNIVKNILNDMGIKNIGFVRGNLKINKNRFNTFLNKQIFSDNELLFVVKYLSHVEQNLSVLDLNTKYDYKINYYIQDDSKNTKYPIILTTHSGLFTILKDEKHLYYNYGVCFFDTEVWYQSYNSFLYKTLDLYTILNLLDQIYYKYILDNQIEWQKAIEEFVVFFEIFMGVLFSETKKHFIDVQSTFLTINPIMDHINFYETNKLIKQIDNYMTILKSALDISDFEKLKQQIDLLFVIFSDIARINKSMYWLSDFYFTYSSSQNYTNWEEFADIYSSHTVFFTNFDKKGIKIMEDAKSGNTVVLEKISDMDTLVSYLKECVDKDMDAKNYYIISTVKLESKQIFEKMFAAGLDKKALLLIENITGSLWKNLFKAKDKWTKILVGGYNFYMHLLSKKINIDICFDFNIKWKMSEYLLSDMKRYAKNQKR